MAVEATLKAWLALSLTRGLGGEGARQLLKEFGSPDGVFAASLSSLKSVVKADIAAEINKGIDAAIITPALEWLQDSNNHIVTLADSDYPQALLNIPDPPLLLYVKGQLNLLNQTALAIVGSRNATPQGINNAEAFAKSLSEAGLCIISGLAHGIDAAAHRGALRAQSNLHSDISLRCHSYNGSRGARHPRVLMCTLRCLCSGLHRCQLARYDFCCYV